jgi:redox-sensitive bicupin YhaK (pirin superfamily)
MTMSTKQSDPVTLVLQPRARDLGDFEVRRALPATECRSIGPFVFFDHMGPVLLSPGQAMDVRPHPHIGLATITWLFDGAIRHQDSLGYDMVIRPGEVNWMTAGRGIVHSERTPLELRNKATSLHGIQAWMALPRNKEEIEPGFLHYDAEQIPRLVQMGVQLALIAGEAFGLRSPVNTESPTFYAELRLGAGHQLNMPVDIEERAIYVCEGSIEVAGSGYRSGDMLVLKKGEPARISAKEDALCMLLGGKALDAPRLLYWNFVSSHPERIEQAKDDWKQGLFPKIAGDDEFIPLPD